MEEIGPVEYMIVSFPGNRFTGEIAPALGKLVESNTIRIIDLAFVSKDTDGSIGAFELSDIDGTASLSTLMPLGTPVLHLVARCEGFGPPIPHRTALSIGVSVRGQAEASPRPVRLQEMLT